MLRNEIARPVNYRTWRANRRERFDVMQLRESARGEEKRKERGEEKGEGGVGNEERAEAKN